MATTPEIRMASKRDRKEAASCFRALAKILTERVARLRAANPEAVPRLQLNLACLRVANLIERLERLDADIKDPARIVARRAEAKLEREVADRYGREAFSRAAQMIRELDWFSEDDDDLDEAPAVDDTWY